MAAAQPPAPAAGSPPPPAQMVGNAFVHQYYNILYQSPELVYRFYQETSKLGRPEPDGAMSSVTTMQAINEKIMSMDYGAFRAEIKTVDAQESLNGGVTVLVTGYLTGKDNVKRNFTQSFFLATQDKGYFVLNDIFRYTEADHQPVNQSLANGTEAPPSLEQEAPVPQEPQAAERSESPAEEEEEEVIEEVYNPSDNEDGSVVEEEIITSNEEISEVPNSSQAAAVADSSSAVIQEEAPKKSYASIVRVMRENTVSVSVPAASPVRPVPSNLERQAVPASAPAPASEIPTASFNATETSSIQEAEVDGHSIYIRSLPLNATPAQLEEEFKRFGPIKPGGIQVRNHKQGFRFGFVEFEAASAVQSAIEASPITIGGRQAYIEEKRTTGSRVSTRGRFLPGRGGGFRSDGVRGRGNYGGGRGYGRGDYSNRADYGGRGGGRGGSSNRGESGAYQRVDHTVGGRGSRPGSIASGGSPRNIAPQVSASA